MKIGAKSNMQGKILVEHITHVSTKRTHIHFEHIVISTMYTEKLNMHKKSTTKFIMSLLALYIILIRIYILILILIPICPLKLL